MAKKVKELTALEVKKLSKDGFYPLGGVTGLYLRIRKNSALYTLRYSDKNQVRRELSLGSRDLISLTQAKTLAMTARLDLANGVDPIERKREETQKNTNASSLTLKDLTMKWLEERQKANYWINNKKGYTDTWFVLRKHLLLKWGNTPVDSLTFETVKDILRPIWQDKPTTATKLRTFLKQMIDWGMATKLVEFRENPARLDGPLGVLLQVYKNNRKESDNFSAADFKDIPQLISEIHSLSSISARATEFAILTAARSAAVRYATWDEFDFDKKTWTIPVEHDKIKLKNRNRTIILSDQAIDVLKSIPKMNQLVFPSSYSSKILSDTTLAMILKRLHIAKKKIDGIGWIDPVKSKRTGKECVITVHGTSRASFRTWAKDDELGNNRRFDQEAAELCLLHSNLNPLGTSYDRSKLELEQRKIMQEWGEFCYSKINCQ